MGRFYKYGYKLIPIYFLMLIIVCIGLYYLSYSLFDYTILSSYLTNEPRYLSLYSNENYTLFNLITGFFLVFLIGINLSVFIGGGLAIYWSEFTGFNIQSRGINLMEIIFNIPVVFFGYLLFYWLDNCGYLVGNRFNNLMMSSFVLGGMMMPSIIYRFIDILKSIPYNQREGAYSLGANRYKTAMMVLIPSQIKLFFAAIFTVTGRTLNEILIVFLIIGFIPEKIVVIISIFIFSITTTLISQKLKKSHLTDGAI